MKEKFVKLTKPLLMAAMALEIWISFDIASALLFGEYEPPKKPADE